jgi:hypothetical protein
MRCESEQIEEKTMIVHHAASRALDITVLRPRGSTGKGPAAMGLWTCVDVADWQRSYGPVLNRLEIDATASILETTSRKLCDLAGAPTSEAWAALGSELHARGHDAVLLVDPDTRAPCEMIVLDPSIILASTVVEWADAIA